MICLYFTDVFPVSAFPGHFRRPRQVMPGGGIWHHLRRPGYPRKHPKGKKSPSLGWSGLVLAWRESEGSPVREKGDWAGWFWMELSGGGWDDLDNLDGSDR
jgi:hypothetical protein